MFEIPPNPGGEAKTHWLLAKLPIAAVQTIDQFLQSKDVERFIQKSSCPAVVPLIPGAVAAPPEANQQQSKASKNVWDVHELWKTCQGGSNVGKASGLSNADVEPFWSRWTSLNPTFLM